MSINLNIGILGHVDSGKTTLAKCMSEMSSTAAFDKNPQSQQRGITLDLGFSCFTLPMPDHLKHDSTADTMQYTLVDCPGHASLIKTIIGGAQIIDMMLLVVDVTKGIQMQTAECLVIGEICCKKLIVVLNKVDLIDEGKREKDIEKMQLKLKKTLTSTAFNSEHVPIIPIAATNKFGVQDLINCIAKYSFLPKRSNEGDFLFSVDHCFAIKGQGTVMTGTILQGAVEINDIIDIPAIGVTKKVKSMQMFKKPVSSAMQGDRLGVCVTQFDPKLLERGIACTTGCGSYISSAVIRTNFIKYFTHRLESKSKYHITIGHETVLAQITVFHTNKILNDFDVNHHFEYKEEVDRDTKTGEYYFLLDFEKPVFAVSNSLLIGSKLDMDINKNACRIAFWGNLLPVSKELNRDKSILKIYKTKMKTGVLERVVNENVVIVKNMFKKETDLQKFLNLDVSLSTGEVGRIESSFGQSGKIKVFIPSGIKTTDVSKVTVSLEFKRFLFDIAKNMYQ